MAFVVSNLIRSSFHGLDISDEGMYLLSAERPTVDSAFHNPFGDYTGLLYRLSFQQVWLFRVLGILILSLAGIFLARAVHRAARPDEIDLWNARTIGVVGALVAPFYYAIGLYTPSYNWLNLVAICIGLGSILNIVSPQTTIKTLYLFGSLLAIAIWIGTFAKMSTGPGLLALFCGTVVFHRSAWSRLKHLTKAVVLTFVLIAIFHSIFLSSLSVVATKMSRGQEALTVFDPRYTIEKAISDFLNGSGEWLTITFRDNWLLLSISVCASILISVVKRQVIFNEIILTTLSAPLSVIPLLWFLKANSKGFWNGNYDNYSSQVQAVSFVFVGTTIGAPLLLALSGDKFSVKKLLLPLTLLGSVFLYAFGSNNGFLDQTTGAAGVLALLALSVSLLCTKQNLFALSCSVVLILGSYFTTVNQQAHPYRQQPTDQQNVRIKIKQNSGPLFLDKKLAQNISDLREELLTSEWKPRTPLLDLTQYSAGIVFALDAKPPVTIIPTVGGMSNVDALSAWSFDYIADHQENSEWTNAWLLMPNPRNGNACILCPNPAVLSKLGRAFPTDYKQVAESRDFLIFKPLTRK
jgi:hypothetical protein